MRLLIAILLFAPLLLMAQTSTVLVDVFTNSHCSPCAGAHAAVNSSITSTPRASNAIVVYNHWSTYQDDPIYQANTTQPKLRATWLGGVSGTPTVFFNGTRKSGSYNDWPSVLDGLIAVPPSFAVLPTLTSTADSLILTYTVTRTSGEAMPTVYSVLVENVTYLGRNGISEHDGALRALFTPVGGNELVFNENIAVGRIAIARQELWDATKLRAVISVQDPTTKRSLQAAQVQAQMATDVEEDPTENTADAIVEVYSVTGAVINRQEGVRLQDEVIMSQLTKTLTSGAYFIRIVRGTSVSVRPFAITR